MPQIVKHDWKGFGIAQAKEAMTIASKDIPKHHVNATQMCKANYKLWGNYKQLDSTKEYWDELLRL
jgi:hypothetical protein